MYPDEYNRVHYGGRKKPTPVKLTDIGLRLVAKGIRTPAIQLRYGNELVISIDTGELLNMGFEVE